MYLSQFSIYVSTITRSDNSCPRSVQTHNAHSTNLSIYDPTITRLDPVRRPYLRPVQTPRAHLAKLVNLYPRYNTFRSCQTLMPAIQEIPNRTTVDPFRHPERTAKFVNLCPRYNACRSCWTPILSIQQIFDRTTVDLFRHPERTAKFFNLCLHYDKFRPYQMLVLSIQEIMIELRQTRSDRPGFLIKQLQTCLDTRSALDKFVNLCFRYNPFRSCQTSIPAVQEITGRNTVVPFRHPEPA